MTKPPTQPNMRASHPSTISMIGALLCGLALWVWADRGQWGSPRTPWVIMVLVGVVVAIPRLRRALGALSVSRRTTPIHWPMTVMVSLLAWGYFAGSACLQGRDLGPHSHDEFMYLTQAMQLSSGRLWSAMDPMIADFFDSPYLITRPVYAALSWPGTAMIYAPALRLGMAPWVIAAALAGAVVGVLFHLARELGASPLAAGTAAIFISTGRPFHTLSISTNSHIPVLLTAGLATLAGIKWARPNRTGAGTSRLLVFGACCGWALICRPVDALCLLAPVSIMILLTVWRSGRRFAPRSMLSVLAAASAAVPFAGIQLIFDHGVTGHWFQTPFGYYCRRDYPQVAYGFPRYNASEKPMSVVQQKRDLYDQFAVPFVLVHQPDNWWRDFLHFRLPAAFGGGQPAPLLLILVPLGVIVLASGGRGWGLTMILPLPLFCILYAPYTIFLPAYAVLCAPAISLAVTFGMVESANRFPSSAARSAVIAAVIAVAAANLPEINGRSDDPARPAGVMSARSLRLSIPPSVRAIVLYRYHTGNPVHDEPVYNWVADVEQARIVLAHDLGAKDIALFRWFARTQPDRQVYLLDRANYNLHYLGNVSELACGIPFAHP